MWLYPRNPVRSCAFDSVCQYASSDANIMIVWLTKRVVNYNLTGLGLSVFIHGHHYRGHHTKPHIIRRCL